MKIDLHAHVLPASWPDFEKLFGYGGWVSMRHDWVDSSKAVMVKDDKVFRQVDQRLWSSEPRLRDMDATGVDIQVLSTVPVMFSYWAKAEHALLVSRYLNDDIAQKVATHPDRFKGLGTVPLQDPVLAASELKRCKLDLKLAGIEVGTHAADRNLGDAFFDPVFHTACELDMPLFVHPWDMPTTGRHGKYWLPWLVGMPAETTQAALSMMFSGVFEKFPKLRVCFAHGAGTLPYTFSRAAHAHDVYPADMRVDNEHPPTKYLKTGNIFADTLVHDQRSLKLACDVIGEDYLILGSDYPFLLGEDHPGRMIEQSERFSQVCKEKFYFKNANAFLGI
ncbi:2-amino-3-carboxymuconate-6-semialdehyde decarboxylase [Halotydeus destructor]|nr:2-amino-3-carboxymuconate-6-semialdehyde decarboxylase [Halotydeus destructor]